MVTDAEPQPIQSFFKRVRIHARAVKPDREQLEAERRTYAERLRAREAELARGGTLFDLHRRMEQLGCPRDVLRALRGATETTCLRKAREYVAAPEVTFLVFLGPPGVGKSVAAASVLEDFARRFPWRDVPTGVLERPPAMFVAAGELTRVTNFGPEHGEWLKSLRLAELLILDDVGDESTEQGRVAFIDLVLARHRTARRTVITGNIVPKAFRARYGDAVADRLKSAKAPADLWKEKSMRGGR
jgi:DNA replication protein DnaC